MQTEIYYFSGTGNSLAVARNLTKKLNAVLIPIPKQIALENIESSSEAIGLVFPLYDFKAPKIVDKFISKLKNLDSKYIFAVCTYGISPLNAIRDFKKLIEEKGGKLSLGFAVKMPHNGIGSGIYSKKTHKEMFEAWNIKQDEITSCVMHGKEGIYEKGGFISDFVLTGNFLGMLPTMFNLMRQVAVKGWESMKLHAGDKCVNCSICSRICPMCNIKMQEGSPTFGDNCAGCLGCLNWCPQNAISICDEVNLNMAIYHHPDVTVSDMEL